MNCKKILILFSLALFITGCNSNTTNDDLVDLDQDEVQDEEIYDDADSQEEQETTNDTTDDTTSTNTDSTTSNSTSDQVEEEEEEEEPWITIDVGLLYAYEHAGIPDSNEIEIDVLKFQFDEPNLRFFYEMIYENVLYTYYVSSRDGSIISSSSSIVTE